MEKNKAFLMFVSVNEMFTDILKRKNTGEFDFELKDSFILVCSRDIMTDIMKRQPGSSNFNTRSDYQSKYENVEFVSCLLPSATDMEFATAMNIDTFVEQYTGRLYGENQMKTIISMCDIIVNRNRPIFVLFSGMDFRFNFPYVLRDFIRDEMGLTGYMLEDLEGKPIETIYEFGNPDEIRKAIETHKEILLKEFEYEYVFNSLADDMETAYRNILAEKSIEELKAIAKENNIFISRRDDKDRIIKKIMDNILIEDL